jgi:hypothetical protein
LVEEKTVFPSNQIFSFSLLTSDKINQLHAEFNDGEIRLIIPTPIAETWVNSEDEGIYGNVENLQIAVEKDFSCLMPRTGDEDNDTFPHPKN